MDPALIELAERVAGETRRHFDQVAAEMRQHYEGVAVGIRQHFDDKTAETRLHFDIVAEGIRGDVQLLAEGLAMHSESVDRRFAEVKEEFVEVRAMIRLSYAELDRRLRTLESAS